MESRSLDTLLLSLLPVPPPATSPSRSYSRHPKGARARENHANTIGSSE